MKEAHTHFGYRQVLEAEKKRLVDRVFTSVADRYDLMNDLMSIGLHRLWKRAAVVAAGVRPGDHVLDIASGTGDLARLLAARVAPTGMVWMTDLNESMLTRGRKRLQEKGVILPTIRCDAEALPFPTDTFDCVTVAFGLRNMTHPKKALAEMTRVLRPGGRLVILEFSRILPPLAPFYDWYSFTILPRLGELVVGDAESYRYLAESIRVHPDQETLKAIMEQSGLSAVQYYNFTAGIVALHRGFKP
ncbi:MAG: bifunctional demethylmenaquinone methyltransferase/2-methoxy-6-polyprenyl-1,4-benzoquinol methylase UbiE [Hydrogenophilus sp.]|nr:bifunctional demethylmenaquinone methyltransferase/2-methoxy-6-polyprenyl-1,4-benzoquinol methylase UbiE [Hydrogenophilus sp.]